MSFEVKVDADATLKQFDELMKNIAGLEQETSVTFTAWQAEDMNRKFPKVEGSGLEVSTTIYPRSQLPRKKNLTHPGKSLRRRTTIAASRPGAQHKPILRPELFEQLKDRMIKMVEEACTWQ